MSALAELFQRHEQTRSAYLQASAELRAALAAREAVAMSDAPESMRIIAAVVAEYYRVDLALLLGRTRSARIVEPRHIAMWLCLQLTPATLNKIGAAFGRDHGTVIHAKKAINDRLETEPGFVDHLDTLRGLVLTATSAAAA